ncbi:hypothetical protein ACTXG6_19355 [Pseudonocardia sp. Cha107L01]|jgi:hypothetical protein|uniref:hypothetical protein n=1 Tax=Pseudonocardia sp. Cha107L01 TaxID=3457576 RepID=UPI00403ED9B0
MPTTLTDLVNSTHPMAVVEQVLDVWEEDNEGQSRRQEWLGRLESFRATGSEDEVNELARLLYTSLIGFGEELPDMSWVHVAIICDDLLRLGVPG